MPITVEALQRGLIEHDKGVLKAGAHTSDSREFCALEFSSVMRGECFSDAPTALPDIRSLNDGPWVSNESRTEHLLPVMCALWDWREWTWARQLSFTERLVVLTVQ